jgi:hypothetical protein
MKGEEKLWTILNDKLDTLRATNRLPQAIRVAETALEIAKRAFRGTELPLATSFEKLGQLHDQKGDRTAAKGYLLKAHAILEKVNRQTSVPSTAPRGGLHSYAIVLANPRRQSLSTRKQ